MKTKTEKFEEYKLIYYFMNPDVPLKGWITEDTFINLYAKEWNELMEVVEKISDIKNWSINATLNWLAEEFDFDGLCNNTDIYDVCLEFIKSYNQKQN